MSNQDSNIRLQAITSLVAELTNEANLSNRIEEILNIVAKIFHADPVAYFQKRNNKNFEIVDCSTTTVNPDQDTIIKEWKKSDSLAFESFKTEEAVVRRVKKKSSYLSEIFGANERIDIAIPIYFEELYHFDKSLIGIILIRKQGKEPTEEDKLLFKFIREILKIVYEKSDLRHTFQDEIQYNTTIANLKDKNLDLIFERFLQRIYKNMSAKFVSLWVYNELNNSAALRSYYPTEIEGKPVSFSSLDTKILDCNLNLTGQSFEHKKPLVFRDIANLPGYANPNFAKEFNLSWFISFPIIAGGNVVAALNFFPNTSPRDIDEEKLIEMNQFVQQLANVIILSFLLFEETLLLDYDEFLNVMLEFEDEKKSWDNLAGLIKNKMNCEACSIFLTNQDQSLQLVGSTGIIGSPNYSAVVYYKYEKSLTNYAYNEDEPFVYYPEFREKYKNIHKSKFRELMVTPGESKSIVFVKILDKNKKPIGIIRCNNKREDPPRHVGKFTKEDIIQLKKITHVISNIYVKVTSLKEREKERERNLNSLHHELLAPVSGLNDHVKWIEKKIIIGIIDEEKKKKLAIKKDDMIQIGKLLDMLVASLGNFEGNNNIKFESIDFPHILQQCKSYCYNEAQLKNLDIQVGYVESKIEADFFSIMRVFYNLIRNSIKYSDRMEYKSYLRITSNEIKDKIQVLFTDNGIGIVEGEEERIFEKFERGSNSSKVFPEGTGLGLAFCRSILQKHNGTIQVKSNMKPTIFELVIPKHQIK